MSDCAVELTSHSESFQPARSWSVGQFDNYERLVKCQTIEAERHIHYETSAVVPDAKAYLSDI